MYFSLCQFVVDRDLIYHEYVFQCWDCTTKGTRLLCTKSMRNIVKINFTSHKHIDLKWLHQKLFPILMITIRLKPSIIMVDLIVTSPIMTTLIMTTFIIQFNYIIINNMFIDRDVLILCLCLEHVRLFRTSSCIIWFSILK